MHFLNLLDSLKIRHFLQAHLLCEIFPIPRLSGSSMMITAHVSYFTLHRVLLHALYIQLGCEDLIREHIITCFLCVSHSEIPIREQNYKRKEHL